jgi:hypothetical protein
MRRNPGVCGASPVRRLKRGRDGPNSSGVGAFPEHQSRRGAQPWRDTAWGSWRMTTSHRYTPTDIDILNSLEYFQSFKQISLKSRLNPTSWVPKFLQSDLKVLSCPKIFLHSEAGLCEPRCYFYESDLCQELLSTAMVVLNHWTRPTNEHI